MTLSKYPSLSKALEGNDMAKLQLMAYVADCEKADAIAFAKWLREDQIGRNQSMFAKMFWPMDRLYLKYLEETSEI